MSLLLEQQYQQRGSINSILMLDMLNLREIKIHNGPQGRYKTVVSHISSSCSVSYLSVQLHVLDIVLAIHECMLKKDKLM